MAETDLIISIDDFETIILDIDPIELGKEIPIQNLAENFATTEPVTTEPVATEPVATEPVTTVVEIPKVFSQQEKQQQKQQQKHDSQSRRISFQSLQAQTKPTVVATISTVTSGNVELPPKPDPQPAEKKTPKSKISSKEPEKKRKFQKDESDDSSTSDSELEPKQKPKKNLCSCVQYSTRELAKAFEKHEGSNIWSFVRDKDGNIITYTGVDDFDSKIFFETFFEKPNFEHLEALKFLISKKYLFQVKSKNSKYPNFETFLICQIQNHQSMCFENGILEKGSKMMATMMDLWKWQHVESFRLLVNLTTLAIKKEPSSLLSSAWKIQDTVPQEELTKEKTALEIQEAIDKSTQFFKRKPTQEQSSTDSGDKIKRGRPKLTDREKEVKKKEKKISKKSEAEKPVVVVKEVKKTGTIKTKTSKQEQKERETTANRLFGTTDSE